MAKILKEMRVPQLCSKSEWTLRSETPCTRYSIIRLTFIPIFLQLGYPLPKLVWYTTSDNEQQGGSNPVIIVDSSYDTMGGATRNTLSIPRLQRSHFGQTFACIATNNNVTDHVATNVTIDMRRKLLDFCDALDRL